MALRRRPSANVHRLHPGESYHLIARRYLVAPGEGDIVAENPEILMIRIPVERTLDYLIDLADTYEVLGAYQTRQEANEALGPIIEYMGKKGLLITEMSALLFAARPELVYTPWDVQEAHDAGVYDAEEHRQIVDNDTMMKALEGRVNVDMSAVWTYIYIEASRACAYAREIRRKGFTPFALVPTRDEREIESIVKTVEGGIQMRVQALLAVVQGPRSQEDRDLIEMFWEYDGRRERHEGDVFRVDGTVDFQLLFDILMGSGAIRCGRAPRG